MNLISAETEHFPATPGAREETDRSEAPNSSLKKIDTSHPELYLEQNSEVKKSHERIHAFGNEDDENEAQ